MLRVALGVLAGFAIGIWLVAEVRTPWAFLLVVCSLIARGVIMWGIHKVWGMSLTDLWHLHQPDQAQFWRHAWAYIKGEHEVLDPLACGKCRG